MIILITNLASAPLKASDVGTRGEDRFPPLADLRADRLTPKSPARIFNHAMGPLGFDASIPGDYAFSGDWRLYRFPDPARRAEKRGVSNDEVMSPVRAPDYQPPIRQYREVTPGHVVQLWGEEWPA
jgi:hypothetical protein